MKAFSTFSFCPNFSKCSGCENRSEIVPVLWEDVKKYFNENQKFCSLDLFIGDVNGCRYRAKLAIRAGFPFSMGLFKKKSHEVMDIEGCPMHHPSINESMRILRKVLLEGNVSFYHETTGCGLLRYVQFLVEKETQKVQLSLVLNSEKVFLQGIKDLGDKLSKEKIFHSIWMNFHPHVSNRIFGDEWDLLSGEEFVWQTFLGKKVAFHPASFSQTHLPLFETMLISLKTFLEKEEKVIEFYAGVGAIGLSLLDERKKIVLIEDNPFSFLSFQESVKQLSSIESKNITYHNKKVNEALFLLEEEGVFIVDPPRKGLDIELLEKLCSKKNGKLIYISCHFTSFKKDTEKLLESGWELKRGEGYLFFPASEHIEIVAFLEKRSG